MVGTTGKRAAHRPSRRDAVVEAAMHLYSMRSIEDVTVADIAAEAKMTSAAVYYHYPSKDEVLLDGLRLFTEALLVELHENVLPDPGVDAMGDVLVRLLEWTDDRRPAAIVYFVRSPGLSLSVEALRREVRLEMLTSFGAELKRAGVTSKAMQGAAATALFSLLEVAAASWLTEDFVLANLGRRRFSDEVRELALDICST